MTTSYGPHLIDFYDLPPSVSGERTPRLIGRLTEAGAAIRDSLPVGNVYPVFDSQADFVYADVNMLQMAPPFPRRSLGLLIRTLGLQARLTHCPKPNTGLDIDIRTGQLGKARAPEWHRDAQKAAGASVSYIIGDSDPLLNTEYATIPVSETLLPYGFNHIAGSQRDMRVTEFLRNANALSQIGSNEILELFGDAPHRSSPAFARGKNGWRFLYYKFN